MNIQMCCNQEFSKLLLREFLSPKRVIMEELKNVSKHFKILLVSTLILKRS